MTVADISTVCGLPEALSAITKLAACVFVTLESAVKLMRMMQLFPALRVFGHNSTPRKPDESSPVIGATLKLVNVIIDDPVLVSVVKPRAGRPTYTVPKLIVVGENFSVEPLAALTVCETLPDVPPLKLPSPP